MDEPPGGHEVVPRRELLPSPPVLPELPGLPALPGLDPPKKTSKLFGVALVVGALLALLPVALIGWWGASAAGNARTAEALAVAGGLDFKVFESAYWVAFALNAALLGWTAVRVLRARTPWLPLGILAGVYLLGYAFVVMDARGEVDMPDLLAASVLLGASSLWKIALPVAVLSLLATTCRALWRGAARTERWPRAVGVTFLVAGLAGGIVLLGPAPTGSHLGAIAERGQEPWLAAPGATAEMRDDYAVMVGHVGYSGRAEPDADSAFQSCCVELAVSEDKRGRREIDDQVARVSKRMPASDAYDLVMDALVRVCLVHAEQPRSRLVPYFTKAVTRAMNRFCGRNARFPHDRFEQWTCPVGYRYAGEGKDLERALMTLDLVDRTIVRMRIVEGHDYGRIAREVRKSESNVRKRKQRALETMRASYGGAF